MSFNHPQMLFDRGLNQALFSDGYIKIPLLNIEEVQQLSELFYKNHTAEEVDGLYVSSVKKSKKEQQDISDSIHRIFGRALRDLVMDGDTFGGTFITKAGNQTEALEPHQDWSVVDESRFRTFTIWVPLTDVDDTSGCLYVLPKSHDLMRGYRHLTIPSVFGQIYKHTWKRMTPVPMKAGEAIIFDQAIGHASKPNTTHEIRIAATHSLISTGAEMRFYWNNKGTVEEFVGESDYYNTEQAKFGPGPLRKLGNLDFKMEQLTEEKLDDLLGFKSLSFEDKQANQSRIAFAKKQSFLDSIRAFFN